MQKNIIITLILSIFIAVFAILNAAAVPINLVFTTVNISAALVILISSSLGAVIVYLMDTITKMKNKKLMKEQDKTIINLTTENQTIKTKNAEMEAELELLKEQINIVNDNSDNSVEDTIESE